MPGMMLRQPLAAKLRCSADLQSLKPSLHQGRIAPQRAFGSFTRKPISQTQNRISASSRNVRSFATNLSSASGPQWNENFVLDNPLANCPLKILDTKGNAVSVKELASGRAVLGLLRHLG